MKCHEREKHNPSKLFNFTGAGIHSPCINSVTCVCRIQQPRAQRSHQVTFESFPQEQHSSTHKADTHVHNGLSVCVAAEVCSPWLLNLHSRNENLHHHCSCLLTSSLTISRSTSQVLSQVFAELYSYLLRASDTVCLLWTVFRASASFSPLTC